ncbi:hypothetical protein [Candidatus Mycoplasma haematohominis]|uniref:Uncharacterized protein n=1 Tax=Candidatus Mycoplasma haematohominis TaxID=1494318 RepID=A0A478FSS4_9MOLU|nr:hypothetical protein [Candidatus Mycoplasma haemohominis]GCE63436.1 hypothetical protein MHSWG343_04330 [Candidatus Mycoplasma haemohominis]
MKKLNTSQKRQISAGAIPVIGVGAIRLLHGILAISWLILDVINIVADYIPKEEPKSKNQDNYFLKLENGLTRSKNTILS